MKLKRLPSLSQLLLLHLF